MPKTYEMENDYILEVLLEAEDKLSQELNDYLSEAMKFKFAKFLAVRNKIERINIEKAFEKRVYDINNKKLI